jgi:hypothetical protein
MHIRMSNGEFLEPEAIGAFLDASQGLDFAGLDAKEVYRWVEAALIEREYFRQGRKQRGKVSGRSLAQISRLIRQYREAGELQFRAGQRHRFARSGHPPAGRQTCGEASVEASLGTRWSGPRN